MLLKHTQHKLLLAILIALLFCINVKCQEQAIRSNEFKLGIGAVHLKDAERMPSGISGTGYFLQFKSSKEEENKLFEYESRFLFVSSSNKYIKIGSKQHSSGFELNTGGMWSRKISFQFLSAEYFIGLGESLNGHFFYQTPDWYNYYYQYPFGKWLISSDLGGGFFKKMSSCNIVGQIKIPVLAFGHFDEYQNRPLLFNKEVVLDYLTPNNIVTINKYFDLRLNISVIYCISSSKRINLTCGGEFNFSRSNVFNHLYLRQSNLFYLGILY